MTHLWTSDPKAPGFYMCVCGLRRKWSGGCATYIRDGVVVSKAGECPREHLDGSSRRPVRMPKLAPFLRGDFKGEAARAALPKKPPGREVRS